MGYQGTVYVMRPSAGEGQPEIDLEAHDFWDEWDELDRDFPPGVDVLACRQLSFTVNHPLAVDWDWYYIDVIGAMSVRACRVLWPYRKACCSRFQTTINGRPYFILRPNGVTVDCVIRTESILEPAPDDPNWFLDAKRLRFIREPLTDPQVFMVPEQPRTPLATEAIKRMVDATGLTGFEFVDCEHLRGYV